MKIHSQHLSNTSEPDSNRFINILIVGTVFAGIILSLTQFLFNRSLNWDEAALALNIIHRNSFELLQPLDYVQVAPILFLQIEKLFSTLIPNSEYGLRIFPLLCFWASIYFFYRIIKKQLKNSYKILIALSLFVFNYLFLYYSGEVKQYMSDALIMLCMFYFTQKDYKKERNKYSILAFAGVIAIFMSNVAPIILFTCGLYLAYDYFWTARGRNIFPIAVVFVIWLSVFLLYYVIFIHEHPVKDSMVQYWTHLHAFLPVNPFATDFYLSLISSLSIALTALYDFETYMMRLIWKIFLGLFMIIGLVVLIKRKKIKIMIFVFTPLAIHLLLSAFHLYPFFGRFILYAIPCIIILFAYAFYTTIMFFVSALKTEKIKPVVTIVCVAFFIVLLMIKGFPIKHYEERIIKFVQENIQNSDKFYIPFHYGTIFKYYTETGIISDNMNIVDMQQELTNEYAKFWMKSTRNIRKQMVFDKVKTLHGRNWVIFGSVSESPTDKQLDSLGYKKLREFHYAKTSVYLYDFGE
jgi:hypothetical protein